MLHVPNWRMFNVLFKWNFVCTSKYNWYLTNYSVIISHGQMNKAPPCQLWVTKCSPFSVTKGARAVEVSHRANKVYREDLYEWWCHKKTRQRSWRRTNSCQWRRTKVKFCCGCMSWSACWAGGQRQMKASLTHTILHLFCSFWVCSFFVTHIWLEHRGMFICL